MNSYDWIAQIAESRIQEAMEKGEFDNLPGAGKPLCFENTDNVPEELRMAYKILKNAGAIPEELARRREIVQLADLLDNCRDEKEKITAMRRLRALLLKCPSRMCALEENDAYFQLVLAKLEKHERNCAAKHGRAF